jgi:hypothetical protein
MNFLKRMMQRRPTSKMNDIQFNEKNPWVLTPTSDVSRFLRALPLLFPEPSVAYFEDTGEKQVAGCLQQVSISVPAHLARGTIWPKPDCYHVSLTPESMETIAAFLDHHPAGYFCTHLHVHRESQILLAWYDAFSRYPMWISRTIDEERVKAFASAILATVGSN